MLTLLDYKPVKMKCPYCKGKWKQHFGYLTSSVKDIIYCPWCSAEIQKDMILIES